MAFELQNAQKLHFIYFVLNSCNTISKILECFQMKTLSVKKCSSSNKVFAHTKKRPLAPILHEKKF